MKLFGKPVSELTLAECASLAGITKNPARYDPLTHPTTTLPGAIISCTRCGSRAISAKKNTTRPRPSLSPPRRAV